jgi:hypothetical protein
MRPLSNEQLGASMAKTWTDRMMQGIGRALVLLWRHVMSMMIGIFSIFLIFQWAIVPVPTRGELIEVAGPLASYSIEQDNSWFSQHLARRRDIYVLFKLADYQGRFWSGAVGPENVKDYFSHLGADVRVYRVAHKSNGLINGDGEKTWGLSVDGQNIQSVEEALSIDHLLTQGVLPFLGLAMVALAIFMWKKEVRDAEKQGPY